MNTREENLRLMAETNAKIAAEREAWTGRWAKCSCGRTEPSTEDLAFRQTAAQRAHDRCAQCGYAEVAHTPEVRARKHLVWKMGDGHEFVATDPSTFEFDTFYCGCRGWD
jgi:hypothetical protein